MCCQGCCRAGKWWQVCWEGVKLLVQPTALSTQWRLAGVIDLHRIHGPTQVLCLVPVGAPMLVCMSLCACILDPLLSV
jgi:hypothetical protein